MGKVAMAGWEKVVGVEGVPARVVAAGGVGVVSGAEEHSAGPLLQQLPESSIENASETPSLVKGSIMIVIPIATKVKMRDETSVEVVTSACSIGMLSWPWDAFCG